MRDRRFWSKRAAWCLGVALLGYWVVWLAVPPLVKWQGERLGTAALGREVRIGRVAFSPWKLDLVLDDVQIGGLSQAGADSPPMLRLARLHLDFAASSLIRGAPVIQALDVDGLQVQSCPASV